MNNRDYKNEIFSLRRYSGEQFDKLLVYLSSGALVLTVGFLNSGAIVVNEKDKVFILFSWASFTLSLIAILISHLTSTASFDASLYENSQQSQFWNYLTKILNYISLILLFIGLILFFIVAYINL